MATVLPAVLQAQAAAQAPGQSIGQAAPPPVSKGKKQVKGKAAVSAAAPNPAASMYPNLPTTGG